MSSPVAVSVERLFPRAYVTERRYRVIVHCGVDRYGVVVSLTNSGKHVIGAATAGGYAPQGARRALVEQAAREAVLA